MTLDLKTWPMSLPGSKRRMIGKLWPKIPRPDTEIKQPDGCPMPGVGGMHSDTYFDPDGGGCVWCGEEPGRVGRFVVPFFGTGVDSGHFVNEGFDVIASDAQPLLVELHNDFGRVVANARSWTERARGANLPGARDMFFKLRTEHNANPRPWMLYTLGKHAHSQLIRHNRAGKYNAAFGQLRKMPNPERVAAHVAFVESIEGPTVRDFADAMRAARFGDVAYLDPPYFETFDAYTGQPFDTPRLLSEIVALRDRGIAGAMSNSPAVVDLLEAHGLIVGEGVEVYRYTRAGTITVAMNERQPVAEVLVVWEGAPPRFSWTPEQHTI